MPLLTALAVFCTTNVLVGRYLGYQAASMYLVFWLLSGLAALAAWNIVSRVFPPAGVADACVRTAILAFAIVVLSGLALGTVGGLTVGGYLVAQTTWLGASCLFGPRRRMISSPSLPAVPVLVVGIVGALLTFSAAFAVTHSPLTLYDSVSYHLFFAARWLQDRTLSIIPTPFSDEAQAYAPANGELFLLWLMLPFHGDLLARMGQLPFALLAGAALYALGRRLGAPAAHAAYPPAFFLLSRPTVEQAIGANVDLICAATFLTSLYLGIVALDRNERRDWIFWGISLGLYCGSKYVALVYTPVLLLLALARGPRTRTLWALPGIGALALPWYLRNWIIAGSPIYPASVKIAGITLARGAFGHEAMLDTVFHTNDVGLFPAIAARAFGPTLLVFWIPAAIVGGMTIVRRGWYPHGLVLLVPVLMVPLYWFGFPVNIDSRFLMPAIGPALLPFAFAFRESHIWNRAVHAIYAAGMLWMLLGIRADIPATLPWFMGGWLAMNGLLGSQFLAWFGAVAILIAIVWRLGSSNPRWTVPLTASLCATVSAMLTVGGELWCQPSRCDYLDLTSPFIRSSFLSGWQWIAVHVQHGTFAYTGNNLPYPLIGPQLANRVSYVNIDRHREWRFHDYVRARKGREDVPVARHLALSSGELMPVSRQSREQLDALRPRYERMEGNREGWIGNLSAAGVDHLFVSALSAYEIDYVWHNDGGFPIEDEWARGDPRSFQLLYENSQVRIYAIDFSRKDGG